MQPKKITLSIDKLIVISNIIHNTGLDKLKEFNSILDRMNSNCLSYQSTSESFSEIPNAEELNFINFTKSTFKSLSNYQKKIHDLIKGTISNSTVMMPKGNVNTAIINSYVTHISHINSLNSYIYLMSKEICQDFEKYFAHLYKRHSSSGIEIQKNPIATDFAYYLFHSDDIKPSAITNETIILAISSNIDIIEIVAKAINEIWECCKLVQKLFENESLQINQILQLENKAQKDYQINVLLAHFRSLSPQFISYKKSNSEDDVLKFQNKTFEQIINKIIDKNFNFEEFNSFLKDRREEYKNMFKKHDFYTCKISSGNQSAGENPGGLELIPAPRPLASLDDVRGSGFQEIKEFLHSIKTSNKWSNLFLATSPSKTIDKTNVLLIGPPGCGKTEVLRSVAAQEDSIGIFAQGSDFLTCWKGEAEKNPKRLFELGVQLQIETGKQVHFLIDEIDSVLKRQELSGPGETNLSLEFQVLMDGVVRYPGLSVWGTTNYPERIPPAILRRFSALKIVGELSQEDRKELLKHFMSSLPINGFEESSWHEVAKKLNGATGNVIRKVADHIWRDKMTNFVKNSPEEAEKIVEWLNKNGKFDINQFSKQDKEDLKLRLMPYFYIDPNYLNNMIDFHINNLAIQSEIQMAVNTYSNAKKLLSQISK